MPLSPGSDAIAVFNASLRGQAVAINSPSAQVYRGAILTALTSTITTPEPGTYFVVFTVPSDWASYETASVRLAGDINGSPVSFTKEAGTVFTASATEANISICPDMTLTIEGEPDLSMALQGEPELNMEVEIVRADIT